MAKRIDKLVCLLALAGTLTALPAAAASGYSGTGSSNPGAGRVEGLSGVGTRAAEFLTIPVGPRGVAMGGAYSSVADDISAIYWNPAGLGFLSRPEAFLTLVERPLDIRYTYGAVAVPVWGERMVLGAFLSVLNSGDQEITTEFQPEGTGAFYSAYSLAAGGSVAYNFSDRFSAGITVKNVHEDIFGITQNAIAFDMGTNYHDQVLDIPVRLAFTLTNLGTNLAFGGDKLGVTVDPEDIYPGEDVGRLPREARRQTTSFPLPTSFRISAAADLIHRERQNLVTAVEVAENSNLPISVAVGAEFTHRISAKSSASLRAGWGFQQDEVNAGSDARLRGFSAGGGYLYRLYSLTIRVDYAYRDLGLLGANHTYSLSFGF
ncbi:MAG TPA: PorV/PorQ family protein [Candidatus Glassbacteria bacterium]|nr:PorV/PorQ family protein [Candidatus Glassbacteria bacterium]